MKRSSLYYFIGFALLVLTFIFFNSGYKELVRYSELTNRTNTVYGCYQTLSKQLVIGAVINPALTEATKTSKIGDLFHADEQTVIQQLDLLQSTAKDSINIEISRHLDSLIRGELDWLLPSNVPDSIMSGSSSDHINSLHTIDSLISAGIERTYVLLDFRKLTLSKAISALLKWMVIFIALSASLLLYTGITEQRKTAHSIVKNELRFRALIENYDAAIVVLDRNSYPTYQTPALENITGYSIRESRQRKILEEAHPDDLGAITKCLESARSHPGKPFSMAFRFKHKKGHYIWVEVTLTNLLNDTAVRGIVANMRDVGERKKSEDRIKESELRYRSLIEQASDAILVANAQGEYIDVNSSACKLLGYSQDELLSMSARNILYSEEKIKLVAARLDQLKDGKSSITENILRKKDGSPVDVEINTKMLPDGRIVGIVRDITERKKVAEELDKRERRFRALIENSEDIFAMVDENMTPLYRSPSAERVTGYTDEDRKKGDKMDQIHPDDVQLITKTVLSLKEIQGKPIYVTYRLKHKLGHFIWLEGTFTNLFHDPDVGAIVVNMRDITDRKNAEITLKQTLREVSDYKFALDQACIVAVTDQKGIIKYVNDNFCTISKYDREELIGQDHRIINSNHHSKEFIRSIWTTIAKGEVWRNEIKNKAKDGTYYWVDTTIIPFLDEQNKPYQYMAIRADITERKNTELKLSQSLREVTDYKFALDEACIVAITDQKGIINYANDNFCAISKYSRDELIGQDHRIINSGHHSKEFIRSIWTTIAKGKVWRNEIKNKAKDGTYYWVDTTIIPFINEDNKPYQYMAIRADVTERKNTELKLAQTLKEVTDYKFALDQSCIVAITDQKGIIRYANDKFCAISKYTRDELIGQDHRIINSGHHSKEFIRSIWTTIANGEVWRNEIKNKAKDGTYYWVDTTIIPFLNEDNKPYQYMAIRADITERKIAEEKAISSEERFRALVENMSDAIVLNDEQSNLIYQSPSVSRILGYTLEEREGKPVLNYVHPDDLDAFRTLYKKLLERPRASLPFQYRFLHKKGHYVWLEGVVTNLINDESVRAIVANYRDVTDRKEAEAKLRSERSLLRTLIDNLPDYIYVKDTASRHILNNKANVELIGGRDEAETLGKTAIDFVGFAVAQPYHEDDQYVFTTGNPILDREEITFSKTGELKHLLTTKVPLRDSSNNIVGLVGISRDITKQKQIEIDLRNSNYFLESAQRVGKIGHWISEIDKTGKLIWSAETCRIFGLMPEEFNGSLETFFSFVHPDDIDALNAASENAVKNDSIFSIDHRIILRDNTIKWVHEQGETNYDDKGNPIQLIGIVQDITERKQAENEIVQLNTELEERVRVRTEQLQVANKEMEAFTYSVSHDLRSPLRIIDGYAQILVEDYTSQLDNEGEKTLGVIMSNAKKMGQLIDDLLNFSRIGRAEIKKSQVNMKNLVIETLHELEQSGITIPQRITVSDLPAARCDSNLIKHVWVNLLSNAIKYSSAKAEPQIEIGVKNEHNKTVYFVKDNGAGFDMEYYHKLFGVFQRLHSHHEFSGTGVGLAIVQRIITRHGGTVWAEARVNEGATFSFTLD
jgi:PAS domain S-box-containing protein